MTESRVQVSIKSENEKAKRLLIFDLQDKKDAAAKGGRPHVYEYANPATVMFSPSYLRFES